MAEENTPLLAPTLRAPGGNTVAASAGSARLADTARWSKRGVWRYPSLALLFVALSSSGCRRTAASDGKNDAGPGATTDLERRGQREFLMRCSACHAANRAQLAPSVQEIANQYANDPDGIVRWARAPGRRRTEYPPMPSFRHLSEPDLQAIADHMLRAGAR